TPDWSDVKRLETTTHSPEETQRLGASLAKALKGGDILLLSGELGAGKTCLTQGIAWGLGIREHARSPTFVLISEYQGHLPLYHIDLYRLDDLMEIDDLGLDEYLYGDGVCVIEWAEKADSILPEDGLWVRIEVTATTSRAFTLEARGPRHEAVLDKLSLRDLGQKASLGGR
ncbi:MAG: tRNA (adenosine(37)-N6)-threonylcarbamoyltransferase complex ATPase subunit type 1 TsaE, partial [Dehalococcoidia bacterium]